MSDFAFWLGLCLCFWFGPFWLARWPHMPSRDRHELSSHFHDSQKELHQTIIVYIVPPLLYLHEHNIIPPPPKKRNLIIPTFFLVVLKQTNKPLKSTNKSWSPFLPSLSSHRLQNTQDFAGRCRVACIQAIARIGGGVRRQGGFTLEPPRCLNVCRKEDSVPRKECYKVGTYQF